MDGFTHLHVHSHYSLLDGGCTVKSLVNQAKELGMTALALTDHGNMYGAMDFYKTCKDAGIKPIVGIEAYISPTHRRDRNFASMSQASYHMVLLAMNETGFRNLLKLSSRAFMEGFYYRPRMDRDLLREFNEGLICTSACLGGEIPSAFLSKNPRHARKVAEDYLEIFGPDRFFIEIQNQGIDEQTEVNPLLVELAGQIGVGVVGTNDVHFLTRNHKPSHEILCCISTGKTIQESTLASVYPPELYLKSPQEMRTALARWPESADNTMRIAEMCNLDLSFGKQYTPVYHPSTGEAPEAYLRQLCEKGMFWRYGQAITDKHRERLNHELSVIESKGFCSYFLIVWDFVSYARGRGIPCGARGSGVGTITGYVLGLCDVDPLRYGLLFERFLDPARKEMPDIDIDICQNGRAEVIEYVRRKYGHVAQIITYGTLKARAVVRDVGRVMNIPLSEVDLIAKKVPEGPKVTLKSAMEAEPDLRRMYEDDPRVRTLIDHALHLEGLARHVGIHAAGVVVCDQPLEDLVPLCRQADSDEPITQWDGPTVEKVGLLKMDFLGLRTLTILQRTRDLVKANHGLDVDPETIDLNDQKVFTLFRQARSCGVFQFESGGMKDLLQKMQPDRIEDLIAANALYRPGPMELIPAYCARKHKREPVPSLHPMVDDILAETYGIMIYQEQIMQVINRLGKLPMNRALTLIKNISKKKAALIEAERPNFEKGAAEAGLPADEISRIWDLIFKFAGYGFNKSHSARYAIVAFQTAYFKVYYPREFMAATLTFEAGDSDKLSEYLDEAVALDIVVGPPDINASHADFTVVGEQVRFGLAAVKGVGGKAVEAILQARKITPRFEDLFHFCENVDLRAVNRSTIEALIKSGAFDRLGAHRAAMTAAVEKAIELGQARASDRRTGQMNFFETLANNAPAEDQRPRFPDVEPWTEAQLLAAEKETLGFYVTSHPLTSFGRELENLGSTTLSRLKELKEGQPVTIGCMISQVRPTMVKQGRSAGRKMAMLTVEDLTGQANCVVFSDTYDQTADLLIPESMVYLRGTVDRRREEPSIIINEVVPMDGAVEKLTGQVILRLDRIGGDPVALQNLHNALLNYKGSCPLFLEVRPTSAPHLKAMIRTSPKWFVAPQRPLMKKLEELLGEQNVLFKGKPPTDPRGGNGNNWRQRSHPSGTDAKPQSGVASDAVTRFN